MSMAYQYTAEYTINVGKTYTDGEWALLINSTAFNRAEVWTGARFRSLKDIETAAYEHHQRELVHALNHINQTVVENPWLQAIGDATVTFGFEYNLDTEEWAITSHHITDTWDPTLQAYRTPTTIEHDLYIVLAHETVNYLNG